MSCQNFILNGGGSVWKKIFLTVSPGIEPWSPSIYFFDAPSSQINETNVLKNRVEKKFLKKRCNIIDDNKISSDILSVS